MTTKTEEQRAAEWEARIDISEPLAEIARRLDVPYNDIAKITFKPGDMTVVILKRNEHGSFYLDDTDRRDAVTETRDFKVRT